MKGWLFTKTHEPLQLVEKADPHPGRNEVVVDIKASGLCHTDVGILTQEYFMSSIPYPIYIGHEMAGIIKEIGEGVQNLHVGQRVGLCTSNPENANDILGITRDGGYATEVVAPALSCIPLADNVSFEDAAVGTDAGATAYHALFAVGHINAGMKVGMIGIGGLGSFAVQMAKSSGCIVYAADPSENARKIAQEAKCDRIVKDIRELADDPPEIIFDFAGFGSTISGAVEIIPFGGTIVVVGIGSTTAAIPSAAVVSKQLSVLGFCRYVKSDLEGVYKFLADEKLKTYLNRITFEEIPEGLERLHQGGVTGRIVALQD